ncbi:MAG: conserved membrane protein of unknown function [Candidatus Thorarchaeota archaeon]|nr:MAG: conserved membrane protein of unknown function [Candidatus Thorarchaeota archaeon]
MDPLTIIIIIAAIYLVLYFVAQAIGFDRLAERGIDVSVPFFVLIKTERLNNFLTKMGKKFPRAFFNIGIIAAFGGMIFGFYIFTDNLLKFFIAPSAAGGVVPIIPGVTITGLPLIYILIGLGITLLTHEFAHGLASAKDNIPIKSSGLLFLLVLFGGFVEPDEEAFEEKATPKDRMRLLAAGSYANMIWAFIFLVLLSNFGAVMSLGFNSPNGAYLYDIAPSSAAAGQLEVGDVIVGLNSTEIDTWTELSIYMNDTSPGDTLIVHLLSGEDVNITLGENEAIPYKGYIGVYGADYWEPKPGWDIIFDPMFAFHLQMTLTWSFIILFSVALFNLLPIPIFDGDKLLSNGLSLLTDDERKIKAVMYPLRIFSIAMVVLSMIFSFWLGKGLF